MSFDANLLARILLTLVTLGYGLATVFADFNKTHATNPQWTPHARFHVVWQISKLCRLRSAGAGAYLVAWARWPSNGSILVAAMGAVVYGAFFVAVFAMPIYGGEAYDKNGYLPFAAPVPVIAKRWDVNITIFCVQAVILVAGVLSISPAHAG